MDNLSHSVVGLAAGEFLHRSLRDEAAPQQQRTRRRLLLFTGWAASNFPDLDLLLTPLLPAPLGYLLHHRGHTHTLLYAVPQALLLWLLIRLLWPSARELLRQSACARSGFRLMLAIGFALHLSMDFLNSYGLHPFHPFDSRWFYGDMVFIVEPVFWMAFGAPIIMALPRRALKMAFMALLAGVPFYFAARGLLSWASYAALMSVAIATAVLQHRAGERGRGGLVLAMIVGLGFIVVQGVSSMLARENVAQALHGIDAESRLLDAAMTAFPSNPFCWAFVSVESRGIDGSYRLHRGVVSAAPGIAPAADCPRGLWEERAHVRQARGIVLTWDEHGSLESLRRLKAENCFFDAWLRFARMPAMNEAALNGAAVFDARYGISTQGNFTAMALAHSGGRACPEFIPRWDYPRADLLAVPGR